MAHTDFDRARYLHALIVDGTVRFGEIWKATATDWFWPT
jgi:hypothetical protein